MNLREIILAEHSKANCNRIVKWVGQSQKRFDELFALFLNNEYRVAQRAAWPVNYCAENHPGLIAGHLEKLLDNLSQANLHASVKRNSVRLLQYIDIPEALHGRVIDTCINYISTPGETVAVKCFSLSVLDNMTMIYPEIRNEIKEIISTEWQQTPALQSGAKKFLSGK